MLGLLDIDPAAAAPIWRQIEDGMRRLVASGALPVGTAVPSVRELARELRVNPATVSKAYQRLTTDGALEVRRGEGTFVAERPAGAQAAERERLLEAGAARFVEAARSMGVTEEDAIAAISAAWREINNAADGGTQ
jgi:DNA-binding transcriptional regulator YhcF (GntR family)